MTDLFQEADDATPLETEEREGLLQTWITQRRDLNEAEQEDISHAVAWAQRRGRLKVDELLTDRFVRTLHQRVFGEVWKWAGAYRRTERNLGIETYRIPQDVMMLIGDVRYWFDDETYPSDEIALRLHHRLVAIHPFPNGNGRHARLIADLMIKLVEGPPFSWGGGTLTDVGALRARYITALQKADQQDIEPLLAFARS